MDSTFRGEFLLWFFCGFFLSILPPVPPSVLEANWTGQPPPRRTSCLCHKAVRVSFKSIPSKIPVRSIQDRILRVARRATLIDGNYGTRDLSSQHRPARECPSAEFPKEFQLAGLRSCRLHISYAYSRGERSDSRRESHGKRALLLQSHPNRVWISMYRDNRS